MDLNNKTFQKRLHKLQENKNKMQKKMTELDTQDIN